MQQKETRKRTWQRGARKRTLWSRLWDRTGLRGKPVWNWLQLFIVPLALAVIGFVFTMQQDARQQKIEEQRAKAERELAENRAQDEALQAYLDQMSQLILDWKLGEDKHCFTCHRAAPLAQART